MRYTVTMGDETWEVEVEGGRLRVDGEVVDAALTGAPAAGVHTLRIGTAHHRVIADRLPGGQWVLDLDGRPATLAVVDERTRRLHAMRGAAGKGSGHRSLKAPMPGLVVRVDVAAGDLVDEGQGLVIVEAMKMENELRAAGRARVAKVLVAAGDTVDRDQLLVEFEPPDESDPG